MYIFVHFNFVIFFYHRLLSLAKSNLGTIRCCGLTMRGTRWGGSTLRTRNSGEATEVGCNGALAAATPGRTIGDTRGEATEGTETVGATFAMRWRDGMEGDGGGAAGTAASVATKISVAKMVASRETSSKTLQKSLGNSWISLDLISPSYLGVWDFPSNKQSHAPFLAPASAPEAFFATELAAASILGVSRCLADTKGN